MGEAWCCPPTTESCISNRSHLAPIHRWVLAAIARQAKEAAASLLIARPASR